jgi:phenylalanyl-tRNA synthetase beta chain
MKISLSWLKQYIKLDESPEVISELLTDSGLEVEGTEIHEQVKGGLKGVVIGEVLTCEQHPDADKLSITTVDIGEKEPAVIVCGAPNVGAGQKVVVATVGTILYAGDEEFKIKKAKIRGQVSLGMICAEDELGLGKGHDGIMVLDTDLANGTPAGEYFNLENDLIFEIGLTPNRADATGHIGAARDLKALLDRPVEWPSVTDFKVDNNNLPIAVTVENTEACLRYTGASISGVTIGPSPKWLVNRLQSIGLTPINNVVDITNFVLHETGQPLHAFDASEIKGNKIVVKTLPKGTKFKTLDDQERTLNAEDLMICDAENNGLCIAGVFGGVSSGVSDTTTNVFLECAYFSPEYVRKTSKSHGLKTDASFRYERGTDPNINVYALKRAALLIQELAGGTISSEVLDVYPSPVANFEVDVKYRNVHRLIGKELAKDQMHKILRNLDIEVLDQTDEGFKVSVPPYRVDVKREADIVEEILRIYGFNNVELPKHMGSSYLADFPETDRHKVRNKVSGQLIAKGFFEIMTNSLTKPKYAELEGLNVDESVQILNKLSEDLGVMRQSLLFTGLEVLMHNINRKQKDVKVFEFGKAYFKREKGYTEQEKLAIFVTGDTIPEHWNASQQSADFYDLKSSVIDAIGKVTNTKLSSRIIGENGVFDFGMEVILRDKSIAQIGKVKSILGKEMGISQEIFYANIDWDLLLTHTNDNIVFEGVSKFPKVRRDLSLVVDQSVSFESIKEMAEKMERKLLKGMNVFDVYQGDKIEEGKKAYAISFFLQDKEKTLNDKVIDKTMSRLMGAFERDLNAIIRK